MDENKPIHPKDDPNYVPKYYKQNRETEDILFDGTELRDGMVVLLADSGDRDYLENYNLTAGHAEACFRKNQWCTVSRATVLGDEIAFFGTYHDGTMFKRIHSVNRPWLVKKDSIPPVDPDSVKETAANLTRRFIEKLNRLGFTKVDITYGNMTAADEAAALLKATYKARLPLDDTHFIPKDDADSIPPKIFVDPTPTRTDLPVYDGPGSDAWAKNNPARGFETPMSDEEKFHRESLKDLKERSERDEALFKEEHEKLDDLRSRLAGDSKDEDTINKPSLGGSWTGVSNLKRPGSGN